MPVTEGPQDTPEQDETTAEAAPEPTTEPASPFGTYDPSAVRKDAEGEPKKPAGLYNDKGEPLPTFDQRYAEPLVGLLHLGALTKTFDWLGHTFVIRTLTTNDTLAIGEVMRQWQGTLAQSRAYTTAMAAMVVVSVDGKEPPTPVGDGEGDLAWAYQRFNFAKANWFDFTTDKIYGEYLDLERIAGEVVRAMEKASAPTGPLTLGSNESSVTSTPVDF